MSLSPRLTRRRVLSAAALPALSAAPAFAAGDPKGGLIARELDSTNLEFPFSELDSFLVPTESFYVRNHFPQPKIEFSGWRLRIEGAVERSIELTYEEICKLPSRTMPCLLECAGNGRVFLKPKQGGVQWQLGGVGCARWTGVPLAALLERAGVKPSGVEVILEGADEGEVRDEPRTPGVIHYSRSMPLTKATSDVLLAYRMNDADLTPEHGFPVRAIVPGWYGMASVKWLTRIVVTEQPYQGFFQTMQYAIWQRENGLPKLTPITTMEVKSQIARPAPFEVVDAGKSYRIHGAAWSGAGEITSVEISADGGKTWSPTRLTGEKAPHSWRFWEYEWGVPQQRGRVTLMSRATDSAGRTQPLTRDALRRNSMISHALPIDVEVR